MRYLYIFFSDLLYAPIGIIKKAILSVDTEYQDGQKTAFILSALILVMIILFITFI